MSISINTKKISIATIIFICLILVVQSFLYYQNHSFTITKYTIASSKVPEAFNNFKIVQLSDLHNMKFGTQNGDLACVINKAKPDVLAVTGDCLSSSDNSYNNFISLIKGLNKNIAVLFISGNHEELFHAHSHKNNYREYNKFIKNLKLNKIKIIDNSKYIFHKGKEHINFYGFMIPIHFYYPGKFYLSDKIKINKTFINKSAGKPEAKAFNILLAHHPKYFIQYISWGADLTLAGHIHGGVVRIPFIGGVFSPDRGLFPKYDAGEFNRENKAMIVSRGLGNSGLNQRIFNQPEVIIVSLKHK